MATHGTASPFDPKREDWLTYKQRLDFYFSANEVTEARKKRSIFLASCGAPTFKLARSLVEDKLDSTSYDDICSLLENYFEPKKSVIVQRFKFNTRVKNPGESIAAYTAALRALAENCDYGASLKEMLRDRLVCGVNHEGIQRKLLSEKKLDYDTAYSLALMIEAAEKDSKHLKMTQIKTVEEVHYHGPRQSKSKTSDPLNDGPVVCYRCGGPHLAPACKFKETECLYCKKKGVCRAKKKAQDHKKPRQPAHYVQDESDGAYGELYVIRDPKCPPITVQVALNEVPVTFEVDTGASSTVIAESTFRCVQQRTPVDLQPSEVRLKTYTGEVIPILGYAVLHGQV